VRTPKEIAVKLIEACNVRQVKPSVIIREALSRYFDTPDKIRFAIATLNTIRQWQTLVAQLVWQNTRRYNIASQTRPRRTGLEH
jgi:hypothetical protein